MALIVALLPDFAQWKFSSYYRSSIYTRFKPETPTGTTTLTTTRHHVFLSYSRQDVELMRRVREALEAARLQVQTRDDIPPGKTPQDGLNEAVASARCVVVILTPNAKESPRIRNDIYASNMQNLHVFGVLAEGEAREAVPYLLSGTQWADIRENFNEGMYHLIGDIRRHLNI
jgi:hypothetical protein